MTVIIKNYSENCWEHLSCPANVRDKCIVYSTKSGRECWFFMNTKEECPHQDKKHGCFGCTFFITHNTDF